jgi:hypothetical protein
VQPQNRSATTLSAHNLDPESFEMLLSKALAVQGSRMDTKALSDIVELQGAIATGELDVDGAMDLIAARARKIANATGIAIGLLQRDQLVYRAGSGSGVTYVGQHVMATLCVSGHNAASGEILRVENAQTDRRIEAAICRQFGAHSLLILPIYHDRTMAGVLEVLFDEAHAFQQREVLIYRLMAALVGEAMSYSARPEQKKALPPDVSTMRQSIRLTRPQGEEALKNRASVAASATTNGAIYQACGTFIARAGKLLAVTQSAWVASHRVKRVPWYKARWEAAVGVVAVLAIACWIGFTDRRPASPHGVSGPQGNAVEPQMPFTPAKRVWADNTPKQQTALGLELEERRTSRTTPQRVLDRDIRVRYISDDVTVRYFAPKPPQRVLDRNIRVRYISDDVTVRYFTPKLAVPSPSPVRSPAQPVNR